MTAFRITGWIQRKGEQTATRVDIVKIEKTDDIALTQFILGLPRGARFDLACAAAE